ICARNRRNVRQSLLLMLSSGIARHVRLMRRLIGKSSAVCVPRSPAGPFGGESNFAEPAAPSCSWLRVERSWSWPEKHGPAGTETMETTLSNNIDELQQLS